MSTSTSPSARYRFGGAGKAGVLLGLSMRQAAPLVAGCVWLTLALMAGVPWLAIVGPFVGALVSFGRLRGAPLYDVAIPGARLAMAHRLRRATWVRRSLLAGGPGYDDDLPEALVGLELLDVEAVWDGMPTTAGVVRDRRAGTVSVVVPIWASGFAVSSLAEQDALVAGWAGALAPLARERCPVCRLTWQQWTRPVGLGGHLRFLDEQPARLTGSSAAKDYDELLAVQAPATIGHEILLTVTVDQRRVRRRRQAAVAAGVEVAIDEVRLLAARLEAAGVRTSGPWSGIEIATGVRARSDPARLAQVDGLRRSLAAAAGKGAIEWGPLALRAEWGRAWVDGSVHRTLRVAAWPMLPVAADWLSPLLSQADATLSVTVVLEPVPLRDAAAAANRELTALEADHGQKERHGFRLTARERRRHHDVEAREQELAAGHPEFRHAAFITVTAPDADQLDDATARVEQAAAQSLLDVRLLAARQAEGWVCSLPLGRNVRAGVLS